MQATPLPPLSLASMSGFVNQAVTGVVDSFMIKENNDLIICAQHCDTWFSGSLQYHANKQG